MAESLQYGWPYFTDQEIVWENVRCLPNNEMVSLDGTYLGKLRINSDGKNRYSVNLVSIAGNPTSAVVR